MANKSELDSVALEMSPNPYDFIGEVDDRANFAGRQQELSEIIRELRKFEENQRATVSIAIVGPRRIGKSSLLLRVLEDCNERGSLVARVNLDESLVCDSWEFWRSVLSPYSPFG